MRLAELLAIVAICPLAIALSGCARIEQPIGQYSASVGREKGTNTGSGVSPGSSTQGETDRTGDGSTVDGGTGSDAPLDSLDPKRMLTDPVLPTDDGSSGSQPAQSGTGRMQPSTRNSCFTGSVIATRKPLDMYIVMDANVTLPYSGAWEVATSGVRAFVQDSAAAGIGVGLRYFGSECAADPYDSMPLVEVGVLPDNEDKLVAGTMKPADYTSSPMAFALEGGIMHQTKRTQMYPDRKQIVVLISDGFTLDAMCRYTLQDVENAATKGFNATPAVETHVIGFGAPDTMSTIADDILARFSQLNGIARDGGGKSFSVKYNDDPEKMHDALTSIRRAAQPCAYDIPDGMDPSMLNLSLLPNNFVPRVDSREACGTATPGFYYTYEDGSDTPSSVELCDASCRLLGLGDFAALFYRGCPTVRR